jgi:hypothetical protein
MVATFKLSGVVAIVTSRLGAAPSDPTIEQFCMQCS